jgi:hypothetical protein
MIRRAVSDTALHTAARQKFLSLFPRRDQLIWKDFADGSGWRKASGPLLDAQILGVVSDEGRGLFRGCYWSHKTRHAVLDVDQGSKYHNSASLSELAKKLADIGLKLTVYQSSSSGGWHLYLFFDDWAECSQVNESLKVWLKFHGYEIRSGVLELFPSGNALRLPLQKGFAWLDLKGDLVCKREYLSQDEAIASFLRDAEENASNWAQAKLSIESQLQSAADAAGELPIDHLQALSLEGFEDLYGKGKIQEQWEKGREWWQRGLFAGGQRHNAILAVGHYLWYGDVENSVPAYPGSRHNETRCRLIETWLTEKHNGFCRHVTEGRWQVVREQIERATSWRREKEKQERPYYPATDRLLKGARAFYNKTGRLLSIDEMAQENISRLQDARFRIARAVRQCVDNGWQITRNGLAKLAGCSPNTVSKHKDLWLLFASGSHVPLTRGALGDRQDSGFPEQDRDSFARNEISDSVETALTPHGNSKTEEFLVPDLVADSMQAHGCWQWDLAENADGELLDEADSLCSSECLTPCASLEPGDGERLTASEQSEVLPPSASGILAPGSSTDLENKLHSACGINGFLPTRCAGPPHLFLAGFSFYGLGASRHRQAGAAAGRARTKGAQTGATRKLCLLSRKRTKLASGSWQQARAPPREILMQLTEKV